MTLGRPLPLPMATGTEWGQPSDFLGFVPQPADGMWLEEEPESGEPGAHCAYKPDICQVENYQPPEHFISCFLETFCSNGYNAMG